MKRFRVCAALAAVALALAGVIPSAIAAPARIVSTTPSVTGILLAMQAPGGQRRRHA
jgi:iron complex transport system substrate-binding protein